jgi:cytochrome c
MKKTITILSAVAFLAACGNNSSTEGKTADSTTAQEQPKAAEDPEVEKGLNLIAQSDCLTCHQVETKSTGPAYVEVAAKYPKNDQVIDSLSQKIIKGGSGNWGTVPMTPHPTLSEEDAKTMVKYVLSLKK